MKPYHNPLLHYYILIPLHAATIWVGQAVSPVTAGSSRRFAGGAGNFACRRLSGGALPVLKLRPNRARMFGS